MREIRQSGSEGGVARKRHPYPYMGGRWFYRRKRTLPEEVFSGNERCLLSLAVKILAYQPCAREAAGVSHPEQWVGGNQFWAWLYWWWVCFSF
jgi:hypothetical protein